jgi:hypothetical protein
MRRRYAVPLDRRRLFARLREGGASAEYLRAFGAELAQVEDIVSGSAFADFIAAYVPLFVPEAARRPAEGAAAQLGPLGRGQSA